MWWACLINGEVILHWFDVCTSINKDTYLEMLSTGMWPRISRVSNRKRCCCKGQGMADVEIWRKGHKSFHRVAMASKK